MVLLECWVLISPLPWKSRRSKAKFPCWIHLFFFFLNLIFYEERRNFWEGLGWREQPRLPIRANVEVILRSNLRGSVHPKSDQGPKILLSGAEEEPRVAPTSSLLHFLLEKTHRKSFKGGHKPADGAFRILGEERKERQLSVRSFKSQQRELFGNIGNHQPSYRDLIPFSPSFQAQTSLSPSPWGFQLSRGNRSKREPGEPQLLMQ